MIDREFLHRRNKALFILISIFYSIQVIINVFIEGIESVFPPALLFIAFEIMFILLIYKKVNPKIIMYITISCMYGYFYYLLSDSPYLVNYLFMWLALPLSAIYQSSRVVVIAGTASIVLTFYAFFYLHEEIFPNVVRQDFIYFVLFAVFITTFIIVVIRKLREANAKLQQLAYHDALTGAANRLLLKEKFEQLKHTNIQTIAVLFIDMNDFKEINDTYGHEIGDQLLITIVSRLNGVLRDTELLCRLGGDEFVILCSDIDNSTLLKLSKKIQFALERPIIMNHQVINVSASIGWHHTTEVTHTDLEMIIKEADRSMYRAKGNQWLTSQQSETIKS